MTDTIDQLQTDHQRSERLLGVLRGLLDAAMAGQPDWGLTYNVMQYMGHYPEVQHHPAEDVLFRLVGERDPACRTSCDALIAEHADLEQRAGELRALLRSAIAGEAVETEDIVAAAGDYMDRLRAHHRTEERIPFTRAREVLDASDWQQVRRGWRRADDPMFGAHVVDEFQALYRILTANEDARS